MQNDKVDLAEFTRKDFPIFSQNATGKKNLIYLDHAATSQKPIQVIEAIQDYYKHKNSNVHRGAHQLSAIATAEFENAREITSKFIKAKSSAEIVFTRNATEAINLVAQSWARKNLNEGDQILLTIMEHHSNIVPWQIIAQEKKVKINFANITPNGELDLEDFKSKLNDRTRLISLVHISNTIGCCNPIKKIAKLAHANGSLVLLDACQSLAHQPIDVTSMNIDFLAGSSHKLCGPTGIGFLWAREEILEEMPPFLGGGEMINEVFLEYSNWAELPHKFEAGTPAIGEAIGLGKALVYLNKIGLEKIHEYEKNLTRILFNHLKEIDRLKVLGPEPEKQSNRGSLATFIVEDIHSNDLAELLDSDNICIRSGHHCCQPLHRFYKIKSSARASINFTTTKTEIDIFIEKLISNINFLRENV